MPEEKEQADALEQQDESVVKTENESEETIDDVKAKLAKAEEIAENQRIRAEKAERKAKESKMETKVEQKASPQAGLNSYDTIALIDNKVTVKEDIDEVVDYAKLKNISIDEALKSNVVKTILREKAEQRQTANATSTGGAKRVSTKVSDETLLEKAKQFGEVPESDEEMKQLIEARMNLRRKK